DGWDGWEVLGVDTRDVGFVAAARQVHLMGFGVEVELDFLPMVEEGHIIRQQSRGQRDLAFTTDRGWHTMRDRQLEVIGRELQLAVSGREQDIAQDREG